MESLDQVLLGAVGHWSSEESSADQRVNLVDLMGFHGTKLHLAELAAPTVMPDFRFGSPGIPKPFTPQGQTRTTGRNKGFAGQGVACEQASHHQQWLE